MLHVSCPIRLHKKRLGDVREETWRAAAVDSNCAATSTLASSDARGEFHTRCEWWSHIYIYIYIYIYILIHIFQYFGTARPRGCDHHSVAVPSLGTRVEGDARRWAGWAPKSEEEERQKLKAVVLSPRGFSSPGGRRTGWGLESFARKIEVVVKAKTTTTTGDNKFI